MLDDGGQLDPEHYAGDDTTRLVLALHGLTRCLLSKSRLTVPQRVPLWFACAGGRGGGISIRSLGASRGDVTTCGKD